MVRFRTEPEAEAEANVEFVRTVFALGVNPIAADPARYLSTRSTLGSLSMPRTGIGTWTCFTGLAPRFLRFSGAKCEILCRWWD